MTSILKLILKTMTNYNTSDILENNEQILEDQNRSIILYQIKFSNFEFRMGNDCLATTPNQYYSKYLEKVKVSELKDVWQIIKANKIRKIFDAASEDHPTDEYQTYLTFQKFRDLFPEFRRYQTFQIKRIYEIFDFENLGFVDWNGFYSTISICYFAPTEILAVFMFMIFDSSLEKTIDHQQIKLLVELNSQYIHKDTQEQDEQYEIEPEEVIQSLKKGVETLSIEEWLKRAPQFFDFDKYRRIFNIFVEEEIEKQLVRNFSEWNNLYDEKKQRYISYVVSFKWFQSWKLYVQNQYNQTINLHSGLLEKKTIRTSKKYISKNPLKTKKTMTTRKLLSNKKRSDIGLKIIKIKNQKLNVEQNKRDSFPKNIDFIHSTIGEKPRQIYNKLLEGQYEQNLKTQINQNMDYVLVSQKIWKDLSRIYDYNLQFRRSGSQIIQMYPKIVKIYSDFLNGFIDYSTEINREVSGFVRVQTLFTGALDIQPQELKKMQIFYKTIGMKKWTKIESQEDFLTDLTPETIIFLVFMQKQNFKNFEKNYLKKPQQVIEVNVGDYLTYKDTKLTQEKLGIYMGKNVEGKYIIHFENESYIYDICLMEDELRKYCKLSKGINSKVIEKKQFINMVGMPNTRGTGFLNALIIQLLNNKALNTQIHHNKDYQEADYVVDTLLSIDKALSEKQSVQSSFLVGIIQYFFAAFIDFEFPMCNPFLNKFFEKIKEQLDTKKFKNEIQREYLIQAKKTVHCLQCNKKSKQEEQIYCLKVPLSDPKQSDFTIIFVPSSLNPKGTQIRKYCIRISPKATLGQLEKQFQSLAQIQKVNYLLCEVYSNMIIKNYSSANKKVTLEELKMRQLDEIYAYELYVDFSKFVYDHYSHKEEITDSDIKKQAFIDCYHPDKGWIFGRIAGIEYLPYTQTTIIKVLHKFTKNESWEIHYDVFENIVAKFPIKSSKNAEQYHMRMSQRCYTEANNSMQICNIPLIGVLSNWMRWRQFFYLIYMQVRRFIAEEYDFVFDEEEAEQLLKKYKKSKDRRQQKMTKEHIKQQKFKQYTRSSKFPFKLNITDLDTRCALCDKFTKSIIYEGEEDDYCDGCDLLLAQPVAWQIKASDSMICIDWKDIKMCKVKRPIQHQSCGMLRKNSSSQKLQDIIHLLGEPDLVTQQSICCNIVSDKQTQITSIKTSNIVPIYIQRIYEEEDGFKTIRLKSVEFEFDNFMIEDAKHSLIGVISIKGQHKNMKYLSYVLKDGQWLEYDGIMVRIVDEKIVASSCVLVLFYRKS